LRNVIFFQKGSFVLILHFCEALETKRRYGQSRVYAIVETLPCAPLVGLAYDLYWVPSVRFI